MFSEHYAESVWWWLTQAHRVLDTDSGVRYSRRWIIWIDSNQWSEHWPSYEQSESHNSAKELSLWPSSVLIRLLTSQT